MTEHTGDDHVGTLAQEALKLARVLADQASQGRRGADDTSSAGHRPETCDSCPLCQLMTVVRHARPEVADHLTSALASLTLAARGVVDAWAQTRPPHASGRAAADGPADRDGEGEPWG